MQLILLIILQCALAFNPTAETNLAFFNILKDAFNQENPSVIYHNFHDEVKNALPFSDFAKIMVDLHVRLGDLDYFVYATTQHSNPIFLVAFAKELAAGLMYWTYKGSQLYQFIINDKQSPTMMNYILNNPEKTAFTLIQDGVTLISYNGDREQPLQSVMKIPVAIEFSRQVIEDGVNKDTMIKLEDLNKFYIKNFDSAHDSFLKYAEKAEQIVQDEISLQHIAEGMLIFSSNANTEFLQTYLTMEKIEQTIKRVGLKQSAANYLVSSILAFYNFDNLPHDEYIEQIQKITIQQFYEKQEQVHQLMVSATQEAQDLLNNASTQLLDAEVLAIQANFVTASTTNEYTKLMDSLNLGKFFNEDYYNHFYKLIGIVPMGNQSQKLAFDHAGVKGGSSGFPKDTNCMLNIASFSQLKKGYPAKNVAYTILMEGLDFEVNFQRLLEQLNDFGGLISLNGYFNIQLGKRFVQIQNHQ